MEVKYLICDICKINRTTRWTRFTRHPELRIDWCEACKHKVPKDTREYVRFAGQIKLGRTYTEEEIDRITNTPY